ncbi:MAG: flagellar motor switch protein FliN [Spirochaetes bacterium]|jgi:flagellar motor switch protein FliN/FliY|nr:flagellar motor switch protein FliN [Spirochaetota bacterium]
MGDGSLSQDEIDALLQGADDMLSSPGAGPAADMSMGGGSLSPVDRDALADALNRAMAVAAPSLSAYLGKNVKISNATVELKAPDAVRADFGRQYVQVAMGYSGSLNGRNLILFSSNDAGVISSLMMGDETGTPPADLTEAHQSTIQEFVSQLLSSSANHFADRMGRPINTTPPALSVAAGAADLRLPPGGELAKITYNISIEGILNSKFYHIMEASMASELARGGAAEAAPGQQYVPQQQMGMGQQQMPQVGISPVKFPPLGEGLPSGVSGNIGLLLDVPMTLTVELGRTRQLVKDILGLGEGSIIELDKLAGEPVDLLVNGKLIAKGEVVVIDENFGVRVTDIVSPAERLNKIQ